MTVAMNPSSDNAATVVDLPAVADLAAAEGLRDHLLDALVAGEGDLVLRAEGVERLSTACVQVLLAAGASLSARGNRLILTNPSPAVDEAFDRLGLGADLHNMT